MRLLILLLSTSALWAAVDGTVVNKSTGRPQAGVTVSLTKLGQGGMSPAGSVTTDAQGKFAFESAAPDMHLIQAVYKGVTYNLSVQPGAPTTGLQVFVFDSSATPIPNVDQHMILIETDGKELVVNEAIIYKNETTTTWADPVRGTLRFYVPAAAGENVRARATAPGGMPVDRPPKRSSERGGWFLDYPVKPGGETRFDISYKLPAGSPTKLEGRILHGDGPVRIVVPPGILVEGEGVKPLGAEPSTQASLYDVTGKIYKITITGAGQLRSAAQPAERTEEDGPRIESIAPPGYDRNKYILLGLMLAVLALGFTAQYLKGSRRQA
jgi:hypothetical protein